MQVHWPRISRATVCVAAVSMLYWITAGLRAAYRPLWYDELVTWHLARMPDIGAIWSAITAGRDSEMPLVQRFAHRAFGPGASATSLPMLVGFWILILALYTFLRRRLSWQYALIGAIFPILTFAWPYAFEARAYGILLGCAGFVLVCWQNAVEGRFRTPSLGESRAEWQLRWPATPSLRSLHFHSLLASSCAASSTAASIGLYGSPSRPPAQ